MKVLVLGGSGYVGSRLCAALRSSGWATPVSASRRSVPGITSVQCDTRDAVSLARALEGMDAVVNCVAGSAPAIADGARVLAQASRDAGCPLIVHLSSMAVYGSAEGRISESSPTDPSLGWYARAKCEAEWHVASFARQGGTAVVLRPGCVSGPGSDLWVGRIGRFLRAGRLGDLGIAGDGWSNLLHVDDLCSAIVASLRRERVAGALRTYNLSAPDSPRWNEYFVDLALAIGATPVRRLSSRRLKADALLAGPPLKIGQIVLSRLGLRATALPDPLPPNVLGLWERQLHLDCRAAEYNLDIQWTPYARTLQQSVEWFLREEAQRRLRHARIEKISMQPDLPADGDAHKRAG